MSRLHLRKNLITKTFKASVGMLQTYFCFSYDYVALYDGPNDTSPVIMRHCGQTKPDPDTFVSTGNQMYVRLKADGSVAAKGFSANYSWVITVRYISVKVAINGLELIDK